MSIFEEYGAFNQYCALSFARNWQLPFLDQQKRENDHKTYFMINHHERMLTTQLGIQPTIPWSPVGRVSNWATDTGTKCKCNEAYQGMISYTYWTNYEQICLTKSLIIILHIAGDKMWQLSLSSPCFCTWYYKLHGPLQVSDKQMM